MSKKCFYLLVFLFIPTFPALAEADKAVVAVNGLTRKALLPGFLMALKLLWPFIVIVILMKIVYVFLDKKIENWKKKKKDNQKKSSA